MNSRIAIQDILPNPFRRIGHYKINEAKVAALQDSFKATGVWPVIIGRRVADGKVEIAYGHHRLAAAQGLYGECGHLDIIIQELVDDKMIQMMANENLEDWGGDFTVMMETLQATVEAYGAGRLTVPRPHSHTRADEVRYAPGFLHRVPKSTGDQYPYTATTLAEFLGWTSSGRLAKSQIALEALAYIEEGILDRFHFIGLSSTQVKALVRETRIAQKRVLPDENAKTLPRRVGRAVSAALKAGKIGHGEVRKLTDDISERRGHKPLPPSDRFINGLCIKISNLIDPEFDTGLAFKIQSVIDSKYDLRAADLMRVRIVLTDLAQRCTSLANALTPGPPLEKKALTLNRPVLLAWSHVWPNPDAEISL